MLPDPIIQFTLFGKELKIYMYGVCIAVGILVCLAVFYFYTKKKLMPDKLQDFIFIVAIIAIALGFLAAKLYQAIYEWIEKGVFDFYNSGITAMGGFIGGAAAFIITYFVGGKFVFKGNDKGLHIKEFNKVLLCAPCCITIAHAFGRLGCLCAGCCHGAFISHKAGHGGLYMRSDGMWGYYVPTQLYEALFLFVLFAVLSYLYFNRCNIIMQIYLIAYGAWRIFIEFFRTDARGAAILGLYPSQWQSVIFIAGGVIMLLIYIFKKIPLKLPKE
ncbi:MAG: prolipoprotein diacylglyceryl transferase [Clostridia bacterium]|nr:prolipoprotein diacylglyceryl transferase [Clostridia bacterium]